MKVTATKTFRPRDRKGEVVYRGTVLELDDTYAAELIRTDMAVSGDKSLKDYQNKMQADFADKGLKTTTETPEQRSQGLLGGTKDSETPEERTQGYGGPGADADKDKGKHVEVLPASGPTELDPKRKTWLEGESNRLTRERDDAERNRLGRFQRKVPEATQLPAEPQKPGHPTQLPAHDKDKDQKNRDSR